MLSTNNPVLPVNAQALTEPTSIALANLVQRVDLVTPLTPIALPTTYALTGVGLAPLVLLHGFDSSLLEFRRLLPQLAPYRQTWALDLLGFGFSDRHLSPTLSPAAIKTHLYSFWQQLVAQPMVLIGASMGGAVAIDFALTYPQAIAALVLIDSAGFATGPAMEKIMVPPLDRLATAFLRHPWVRRSISRQAYFDRSLVTPDAELCASLHLQCPDWQQGLIRFTQSGGYTFLADQIPNLTSPTLVIWGEQDRILGSQDAHRFNQAIADSQLVWIPRSGHVPHLEQPEAVARAIANFIEQPGLA
ncbi:MAG: alpha/beta fold hydrolase [Nodosilinea sp.]